MISPFDKIKQQLKCLFPTASKKGIDAINCILQQCCPFDPCVNGSTVFKSLTYISSQLCLTLTINGVDVVRCVAVNASAAPLVFNNGLTEAAGVVKLGGILLSNTTVNLAAFSLDVPNLFGTFKIDGNTIDLDQENIRFNRKINTDDDLGVSTPISFYYPSATGLLKVAPMSFITNLIPVYTSSQGVSKNTLDFRLGDTAVSGTALSSNPFTSHRDITGAFRLSLKNDRILIGSDNTQDLGNVKLRISGKGSDVNTQSLLITNSSGENALIVYDNKTITLGSHTTSPGNLPFINVTPTTNTINYLTSSPGSVQQPLTFNAGSGNIQVKWEDGYGNSVNKYVFQVPISTVNSTQIANVKIETNTSLTHEAVVYAGISNIAELQLTHINSDYSTTGAARPKHSTIFIDGSYLMPTNYTGGEVNFINIKPTYARSTISGALVGITPLRGIYYAPVISGIDTPFFTTEIAFESTRGSIIFGNAKGNETVRLPNLTTTQRDALLLTSPGAMFFNVTEKLFEYHNGNGIVSNTPIALASGSITWNANSTNRNLLLNVNTSITNISNLVPGTTLILAATQDATGGRTLGIAATGFTIKTLGAISAIANQTSVINIYVSKVDELLISIVAGYV